jgi:AbrB family looped-hinge helix DNA binding protein
MKIASFRHPLLISIFEYATIKVLLLLVLQPNKRENDMRVTTKGQVTIPQKIRRLLRITPATEVEFIVDENNRVYIQKTKDQESTGRFSSLRGVATVKMTTEEIMALTRSDE